MALQEALARHDIEKNPADFEAHYNLGAMLQAKNEIGAAIGEYEASLRLRADDAAANNALGAALTAAGHPQRGAISANGAQGASGLFRGSYNLASRWHAGGVRGASREFQLALKLHPDDANVEANLGAALAETGHFAEAKSHFERALQIDPDQELAKENLEALKKEMNSH